jgi:hypothetical protein
VGFEDGLQDGRQLFRGERGAHHGGDAFEVGFVECHGRSLPHADRRVSVDVGVSFTIVARRGAVCYHAYMSDLPEYDGMKRRGSRYEVRISVPPDVAAALHEEAVRRDVGPGVVARGWMREYRAGVRPVTVMLAGNTDPARVVESWRRGLRPKAIIIDDPVTGPPATGGGHVSLSLAGRDCARITQVVREAGMFGRVYDHFDALSDEVYIYASMPEDADRSDVIPHALRLIDENRSGGGAVRLFVNGEDVGTSPRKTS